MSITELARRLRLFYEYKCKSGLSLIRRQELKYLFGTLTEKTLKKNLYISFLKRRDHDMLVDRYIYGHIMTLDLTDRGLSRHLIIKGTHETQAAAAFCSALSRVIDRRDDNVAVLDIGANIGYYTLQEADIVGKKGTVYAVEPDPDNRQLLELNRDQNGFSNTVRIVPTAIGDRTGTTTFHRSTRSNWNRIVEDEHKARSEDLIDTIEVEVQTVESLLESEEIAAESVCGVRMDLEGYETAVVESMDQILNVDSPLAVFIEAHPDFVSDSAYKQLVDRLANAGFQIRYVGQHRSELPIDSFEELRNVEGSHVRLVLER